jgi:hypothetical protein
MGRIIFWLLVLCGVYVWMYGWPQWWRTYPEVNDVPVQVEGILQPPQQQSLSNPSSIGLKGFILNPVASYKVSARVLGSKGYSRGPEGVLSPVDLVLGWSLMSSQRVVSQIRISQGTRYYHWRTSDYPIPKRDIERSSANTHIIPANDDIKQKVMSLSKGSIVTMTGYLVNVRGPDGWKWETSTNRDDTGMGACELFYVENIVVH